MGNRLMNDTENLSEKKGDQGVNEIPEKVLILIRRKSAGEKPENRQHLKTQTGGLNGDKAEV